MIGGERDDLLAEQGAAAPLDHTKLGVDLVGAVEIDVELGDGVELAAPVFRNCRRAELFPRWSKRR